VQASGDASVIVSAGGDHFFLRGVVYTLNDMKAAHYRFIPAAQTRRDPFYGLDGSVVGETVTTLTEDGVVLDWKDVWFELPELSTPEKQTVVLQNGLRIAEGELDRYLFVNAAGEYLIEPNDPTVIQTDWGWRSRSDLLPLMLSVASGKTQRWGSPWSAVLYTLLYALGAASLLWPNQMAFFGRRWQFRTEPELSEDGVHAMNIGSFIILGMAILMLFMPIF